MESDQSLLKTLSNLGIPSLNALQETTLPAIQNHPNVILLAPTGSGKTLAFLLPVLNQLKTGVPGVQCLIVSPTRELAIQIERVWQKMSTGFKVNTCYGGHSMQTETQNLSQPPALLIGTPGRLLEHINRGSFALDGIRILILDEFDKSLSMGFQEEMKDIIKGLGALEKRILVSATNKLHIPAFTGITHPKVLNFYKEAEKSTDGLVVKRVLSPTEDKSKTLFQLLCYLGSEPTLIFCNQRDSTEHTCAMLADMGIPCSFFHGGMEQLDREKTLVQFRNGSVLYLVASDLAARGLDIPEVRNVIHYELPLKQNDFLHRNGRTARMHAEGTAYLLMHPDEPLPAYLPDAPPLLELPPTETLPEPSPWITLYISGGKKDKLSKMDIVGFLSKKGNLQKDDIGKIEVMDFMSFVAVKKDIAEGLLKAIQSEKMKGKKYKIVVAK
ncbi:MAG TPA: DEAD/DEAH box helicase [Saprospiraceae bacterium]|nr:DEAD/DEAH box helicase [Saprospiraceae bacterium]